MLLAVLGSTEDPDPYGENPSARLPELAGRVVYSVRFAETKIGRPNEQSPIADLIHRPWRTAAAAGSSTRSIWTSERPCSVYSRARSRPNGANMRCRAVCRREPGPADVVTCLTLWQDAARLPLGGGDPWVRPRLLLSSLRGVEVAAGARTQPAHPAFPCHTAIPHRYKSFLMGWSSGWLPSSPDCGYPRCSWGVGAMVQKFCQCDHLTFCRLPAPAEPPGRNPPRSGEPPGRTGVDRTARREIDR